MKKYLSFILAICIVFGCVSLISCNFEGVFGKTSSTESTEPAPIEPTKPSEQPTQSSTQPTEPTNSSSSTEEEPRELPEGVVESTILYGGNELTIAHTENFTDDDIALLKRLHLNSTTTYTSKFTYTFPELIDFMLSFDLPILYVEPDIENPYVIVAYTDFDVFDEEEKELLFVWPTNITQHIWYKIYLKGGISENIGNLEIFRSWLVFDCVATDCYNTDESEKYFCKYAFYCNVENIERGIEFMNSYNPMLYIDDNRITKGTFNFISIEKTSNSTFKCHIDKNGEKYLIYDYIFGIVHDGEPRMYVEYAEYYLGDFYERLIDYFVYIPELDEIDDEGIIHCHYGISLDDLKDFLDEEKAKE